jgi:hypothetical protein
MENKMNIKGKFKVVHRRNGKIINVYEPNNFVTDEGKNHMLNVVFDLATPITLWYIGLIDGTGFVRILPIDLMASHAGWFESQDYTEATRQLFTPIISTNKSLASGAATVFTMNATKTLKGLFICSSSVKGDAMGVLWCAALQNMDAINGDQLRVAYKVEV